MFNACSYSIDTIQNNVTIECYSVDTIQYNVTIECYSIDTIQYNVTIEKMQDGVVYIASVTFHQSIKIIIN